MKKVHKLTLFANLLAISIVLTVIEALFPIIPLVPGVKLGLANVMTLLVLVMMGPKEAFLLTVLRVFLAYLLSGKLGPTFYMSISGAVLSSLVMIVLYKLDFFGLIGVSVIGSLFHVIGQVAIGMYVIGSELIIYYLPVMLFLSVPSGFLVGFIANKLLDKFDYKRKIVASTTKENENE